MLILVVGVSILLIISYSFFTSSVESNTQIVVEEKEFNRMMDEITIFFYEKIPVLDKTPTQVLGDYLRWGNESYIFYGKYYGVLDAKEFIENHFNSTFDKNWHLEAYYKDKKIEFGFEVPQKRRLRTFAIRLPVPKALTDGEIINVMLTEW